MRHPTRSAVVLKHNLRVSPRRVSTRQIQEVCKVAIRRGTEEIAAKNLRENEGFRRQSPPSPSVAARTLQFSCPANPVDFSGNPGSNILKLSGPLIDGQAMPHPTERGAAARCEEQENSHETAHPGVQSFFFVSPPIVVWAGFFSTSFVACSRRLFTNPVVARHWCLFTSPGVYAWEARHPYSFFFFSSVPFRGPAKDDGRGPR